LILPVLHCRRMMAPAAKGYWRPWTSSVLSPLRTRRGGRSGLYLIPPLWQDILGLFTSSNEMTFAFPGNTPSGGGAAGKALSRHPNAVGTPSWCPGSEPVCILCLAVSRSPHIPNQRSQAVYILALCPEVCLRVCRPFCPVTGDTFVRSCPDQETQV
jgi:hypothetical protein